MTVYEGAKSREGERVVCTRPGRLGDAVTRKTSCMLRSNPGRYAAVVPDWPEPFRFALPHNQTHARNTVEALFNGFDERQAWELSFTEEQRLTFHRLIFGNKPSGRRRAS